MDLQDHKPDDLIQSMEAELAKALNELRCLQGDADKINGRIRFCLACLHIIKDKKDSKEQR
jgi:hypothetical protein